MSIRTKSDRSLTYVEALQEAVDLEMERDPNVFVIGLNVDDHKAIQGSTRNLYEKYGPKRVIDTPLSEDAMTGVSIGAAMAGMRPIHVHIRMDFLMLCMNQLINMAAKARYMYAGQIKVPLVVRSMIGKSWGQGAQHSQGLHSMFMHVPGLKVLAPSNAYDAKGALITAIRDNNPVIFVEHRLLYFSRDFVPQDSFTIELGRARIERPGVDITIVGISNMVVESLRAQELLQDANISAEIIDPISLMPLDIITITESVKKTGRLLVVDNSWTQCGAGSEIVAAVCQALGQNNSLLVFRMGYAPTPCPTTPALEREYYPTALSIAMQAYKMVRPDGPKWSPDPDKAILLDQVDFRGPF